MAASLKEIMERFEANCLERDDAIPSENIIDIASGGLQKRGGQPPVLCEDTETAVKLWQDALNAFAMSVSGRTKFKWIGTPTLDRWQITMTDAKFTHRVTSDRYTVLARIAIKAPEVVA